MTSTVGSASISSSMASLRVSHIIFSFFAAARGSTAVAMRAACSNDSIVASQAREGTHLRGQFSEFGELVSKASWR